MESTASLALPKPLTIYGQLAHKTQLQKNMSWAVLHYNGQWPGYFVNCTQQLPLLGGEGGGAQEKLSQYFGIDKLQKCAHLYSAS